MSEASTPRKVRVLVIDDEPMVGRSIARALRHHDVTLLTDGESGLTRLKEGELPDVVLCDMMMPGRSGIAIYAELARVRPEALARLVFMTGGSYTDEGERFLEQHAVTVIAKPFTPGSLEALMERFGGG